MTSNNYVDLVETAKKKRQKKLKFSLEGLTLDSLSSFESANILAQELDVINKHITVNKEEFDNATKDYEEIANCLVENLNWPEDSIHIMPQGSSSTQTLIRAPDASKFDIDAVCAVDVSVIEAEDPMGFFELIGEALTEWEPDAKKRCWTIKFPNRRYYIEFTPSIPLDTVSEEIASVIRYTPNEQYRSTALAVVDTPSKQWKTSNPEGFTCWVSDQAKRVILIPLMSSLSMEKSAVYDQVDPVPEQEIPLSDTLRITIRLVKRHRDMAVRRNLLEREFKPISVIIVTLLTQCYEGLANQNSSYQSPLDLLIDLVELMPEMIEVRNGEYWIENPTVERENFAEKWNEKPKKWNEKPKLKTAFYNWCELLIDDLQDILSMTDEKSLREKLRDVFGCTGATESGSPSNNGGLAPTKPSRVHTVPATTGLA